MLQGKIMMIMNINQFTISKTATNYIYTLSLHDALPIYVLQVIRLRAKDGNGLAVGRAALLRDGRSEEHTSELQSRGHLVCRLLLEKKKHIKRDIDFYRTYT